MTFPSTRTCTYCHEISARKHPGSLCAECHNVDAAFAQSTAPIHHRALEIFDAPRPASFEDVHFKHAVHVSKPEDCLVCHGEFKRKNLKSIKLPTMPEAMAFFEKPGREVQPCSTCHLRYDQDLAPATHESSTWIREHGLSSEFEGTQYCQYCHGENTCTACHEVMKPRSHTALFRLETHGLEAEWGRERCMTCHQVDFCRSCHSEVQPRSHAAGFGPPTNNHCFSCHVERDERANCYACHDQSLADTIHTTSAPMPDDPIFAEVHVSSTPGSLCIDCHGPSGAGLFPPVRHPILDETSCTLCHRF